jgi:PTS system fructose-specific IIC component
MSVFSPDLVDLNLVATDKLDAIQKMAAMVVAAGRGTDANQIAADVIARDEIGTPQVDGVAIPHARSAGVTQSSVVVARTAGVTFDPDEDPADVLFMILVPPGEGDEHIDILSSLARRLMDPEFTAALRNLSDANELSALLVNGQN